MWHSSWTRATHSAWLLCVRASRTTGGRSLLCLSCDMTHVTQCDMSHVTQCDMTHVTQCDMTHVTQEAHWRTRVLWHKDSRVSRCFKHHVSRCFETRQTLSRCFTHQVHHTWGASHMRCITWRASLDVHHSCITRASLVHHSTNGGDPTSNNNDCRKFNNFSREHP